MSNNLRPAAVAGMFYPASARALADNVEHLLTSVPSRPAPIPNHPKALIVPHAGYVYSGPIAASAYARIASARKTIRRVVLLGPTHRVMVNGLAIPACTAFATPLGDVAIDRQAIDRIRDLPHVVVSDAAHAAEHSLEVQLPFLQMMFENFSLLPLAVGNATPEAVAGVIEQLWGGAETLIVVSSDLSHYLPYAAARDVDSRTAQCILDFDPTINHQQACGASPINGLLLAAHRRGLRAQLLDLRNSGDTAGDRARVVGYAAFAFYEDDRHAQ